MRSLLLSLAVTASAAIAAADAPPAKSPSFAQFHQRATAGERLSVVFFGASLTWGANASDPQLTSYRAVVGQRLAAAYPKAHFSFWDAAIGGTGSQLGAFRVERDVLRRQPDLVFLDFSANDDIYSATPEPLAAYEAILRRLIAEARAPVIPVIFPFQWNVAQGNTGGMKRRDAHLALAAAYGTVAGDAITLAIERVKAGQITLKEIWPFDGVHPGDTGYALFADAAWTAFQDAVARQLVCAAPAQMTHADTYTRLARVRLSTLAPLPAGWVAARPNPSSAAFDMLMSRWLDDVAVAASQRPADPPAKDAAGKPVMVPVEVAPLTLKFRGAMVLLFGESTPASGHYRVEIDGKPVEKSIDKKPTTEFDAGYLGGRMRGNSHHVMVLAEGLDPAVEHTLVLTPVFDPAATGPQELRFESLCFAGSPAPGLVK